MTPAIPTTRFSLKSRIPASGVMAGRAMQRCPLHVTHAFGLDDCGLNVDHVPMRIAGTGVDT
jgi:hypothetical protein